MSTTPTLRDAAPQVADLLIRITNCAKHWAYMAEIDNGDAAKVEAHRHSELLAELVAALTQGAGAVEPVATVEALQARIAKLEAELDDMEAERDEAERGPWPEWAEQMKKTIRKYSGYDGFDDASEGIDLAAELDELMEHAVQPSAQQLQQAVARALAERDQRDHEQQQNADARAESGAVIQQACEAAIRAKGTHQ